MILRPENARRRLDSLGRITLRKGLRDRMFMRDNEELEFFTFDLDGKMYIALSIADGVDPKFLAAKSILEEIGAEIPEKLEDKLNEKNS